MARPTKLTPKVRRRVLEAAADGLTLQDCAALVGVSRETLRNWSRTDEDFAWAFRRARAEARQEVLQLLKRGGGGGQWRARLAWLARTTTSYREGLGMYDEDLPPERPKLVETMVAGLTSET